MTEAVINARDIWTQAIRDAGVACEAVTRFEGEGQTLFTSLPRIDVYFVRQVNSGSNRGATTITLHPFGRTFSRVDISIATEYVSNGQTKNMSRDDYMCTSAHEFGHAVGILCFGGCPGHSPNPNDVMYSPSRYWTLSNGDKTTIGFIYQGEAYYKPQGGLGFLEGNPNAVFEYAAGVKSASRIGRIKSAYANDQLKYTKAQNY